MLQPMSVSDQIIDVINDLCAKFGVAIDWTAENVMPYIEDLCGRYIQFEIQTSIAWIVLFAVITSFAGLVWAIAGIVNAKSDYNGIADITSNIAMWVFWGALIVGVIVSMVQIYDIIACRTVPEKVIIECIESLIRNASSR